MSLFPIKTKIVFFVVVFLIVIGVASEHVMAESGRDGNGNSNNGGGGGQHSGGSGGGGTGGNGGGNVGYNGGYANTSVNPSLGTVSYSNVATAREATAAASASVGYMNDVDVGYSHQISVSRAADGSWNSGVSRTPAHSSGEGSGGVYNPSTRGYTDMPPLGDIVETLGWSYNGPNTSCEAIAGWSCDRNYPENPVTIHMYVDGKFYTSFVTSNPYPSMMSNPSWPLNYPSCGPSKNPIWGFRYATPLALKDGVAHTIKLYAINQGPSGDALNVSLPNEGWNHPSSFTMQCPVPTLSNNLSAALANPGDQTANIPFTISPSVSNVGKATTEVPFTLRVQVDKKTGTGATGWGYEGAGVNGDVRYQTLIPTGFAVGATVSHDFAATLPTGEYRVRALADPDNVVEASTSKQLADNTTSWVYFTVKPADPNALHPDLSFQSFNIANTCKLSELTNGACPSTQLAFILLNNGTKAIASGVSVPYSIEAKRAGASAWSSVLTGTYTGGVATTIPSAKITAIVPNLKLGTTQLRARVNYPVNVAISETNFDNNISQEIDQSFQYPVGTVTLTTPESVVRYGTSIKLTWSVDAEYAMVCTLTGVFDPGATLQIVTTPGVKTAGSVSSSGLHSTQMFGITCKPQSSAAGVPPDVVTKSVRVEVVPLVQET